MGTNTTELSLVICGSQCHDCLHCSPLLLLITVINYTYSWPTSVQCYNCSTLGLFQFVAPLSQSASVAVVRTTSTHNHWGDHEPTGSKCNLFFTGEKSHNVCYKTLFRYTCHNLPN